MKRTFAAVFGGWLLLAAISAGQEKTRLPAAPAGSRPLQHVFIVSVDGLMPAVYRSPDEYGLRIPTLREMVRNGAWSEGARSVFPTTTYPAHTSMVTGTNPGTHGIVSNHAWDPMDKNQQGWRWYTEDIRVPTLWSAAQDRGLRTALVWWPVTVGARGTAVVPEFWRAGTEDDVKLVRALSAPGVLEAVEKQFPDFRAGFTPPQVADETLTDIAVHLIETLRPHLLLLHIARVDHWEHEDGPFGARALAAVENADRQIARVIAAAKTAGIWDRTALVVASDHGFARISQRVRPGIMLRQKGLVTLDERNRITDWKATVLESPGLAYLYVKDAKDSDTRQTLLDLFLPLAGKPGSGIGRMYTEKEIREKGGDPAAFLALEAADGFAMASGYSGDYISASTQAGTHGYDPDRPEMQASLLVYGPAIVPGKIEGARLIDLAPTVAHWLELKLEKVEGKPLEIQVRNPANTQ